MGTRSYILFHVGVFFFFFLPPTSSFLQSFTRVAELVLQAHKRDVDSLLGSLDDYLEKVDLEDRKQGLDTIDGTPRTCAC